jgi:hypothetical protein
LKHNVISVSSAPAASILYFGDGFGTVQADGSGDYTITVDDGSYILSAYAVEISFSHRMRSPSWLQVPTFPTMISHPPL